MRVKTAGRRGAPGVDHRDRLTARRLHAQRMPARLARPQRLLAVARDPLGYRGVSRAMDGDDGAREHALRSQEACHHGVAYRPLQCKARAAGSRPRSAAVAVAHRRGPRVRLRRRGLTEPASAYVAILSAYARQRKPLLREASGVRGRDPIASMQAPEQRFGGSLRHRAGAAPSGAHRRSAAAKRSR